MAKTMKHVAEAIANREPLDQEHGKAITKAHQKRELAAVKAKEPKKTPKPKGK
jgi:hypothetical protein